MLFRSGEFVWVTDPGVKRQGNTSMTRGIALWEDKVLANLPDGRVIAINRDNGEIIWDKMVATRNEFGLQEKFLTAPLVADGKVLIQNGAGDGGTRGWVAALDVNNGNELWRWYVVPKPGDPQLKPDGKVFTWATWVLISVAGTLGCTANITGMPPK